MNDKTIEIIMMLLGQLKDNDIDIERLQEISDHLAVHGYSDGDIEEAMEWLFDKVNFMAVDNSDIQEHGERSMRVLHDYERMRISPEVYGYILRLKNLSIISGAQMEKILDYCLMMGDQITIEDIDGIIANILLR